MNKKEHKEKLIDVYDNFDVCIQNVLDAFENGKVAQAAFYLGIMRSAADDIFDEFEKLLDQLEDEHFKKGDFFASDTTKNP